MALMNCPECNNQVSDQAKACPHCGYEINDLTENTSKAPSAKSPTDTIHKKEGTGIGCFVLIVIVFIVIVLVYLSNGTPTETKKAQPTRKDKIEKAFSSWNGSHIELTKLIKGSLKNPSSFEHVESKYTDKGSYILVGTTYRATNGFGAVVTETKIVKAKIDGTIIEIVSE
jgi:uncharacterized membrane protein YvbJ